MIKREREGMRAREREEGRRTRERGGRKALDTACEVIVINE